MEDIETLLRAKYIITDCERAKAEATVIISQQAKIVEEWGAKYYTAEKFDMIIEEVSQTQGARGGFIIAEITEFKNKFLDGDICYRDVIKMSIYDSNINELEFGADQDIYYEMNDIFFGDDKL